VRPIPSRPVAALAASLLAAGTVALTGSPAGAASPDLVIGQVYGGGGNTGAPYANDFVELRNPGAAAVDVTGWTVQYASAAGSTWQVTVLSGSVPAGGAYLVAEAAGTGGAGAPLPAPDVTGSIPMSATSGKVALVTSSTPLACATGCTAVAAVRDLVGYGTASDYEGAPVPALSNTTAAIRTAGPDTDVNSADFTVGAPAPRGGGGGGEPDPGETGLRIHDLQGAAHRSPKEGARVAAVPGVVTAVSRTGFWLADPEPDADERTSEGIVVFTRTAPTVAVGDAVTVSGTVTEFRPGNTATNLTTTELTDPAVTVVASGQPLPAPTVVGPGGRVPPAEVVEDDAAGDVEAAGVLFDPAEDGLDFWESLEGMRLRVDDADVVGPRTGFGELPVVPAGATVRTTRGGIVLRPHDPNPERVILDDALAPVPTADVGDSLPGATVGVLDYSFGNYKLLVTATPAVDEGTPPREVTRRPGSLELAVATSNVENLDPGDDQAKFDALAGQVVTNLASPDLLALEEVQDNSGPANDGVVAADVTLRRLVDAIRAAGGPAYRWRQIDPVDAADGGEPGGNIRVAFLFRTDRGLSFVDRPGGTATAATAVVRGPLGLPRLSLSPGRVAPQDPAWAATRKPLAGEFRWRGRPLFAVANHFSSKGGDQPVNGRFQPPTRSSEVKRHAQARLVNAFAAEILRANPLAEVVVLGDINDFEFSTTADLLVGDGTLVDLPRTLPQPERYTYVFEGNSQVLDHILLSPALALRVGPLSRYDYDVVHVNSEYADQVSDHDPQVVRLRP
jgi:predicted extracellular nuclease